MTNTNRGDVISEMHPESKEEIDYLLRGRKAQIHVRGGNGNEKAERKPVFTPGRKAVLGGLAGIVAGAILGPLAIVPLGIAGGYVGAVGLREGVKDAVRAGWTAAKGIATTALIAGELYSNVKNQLSCNRDRAARKPAIPVRAARYGTNEDRENAAYLDSGMLRDEEVAAARESVFSENKTEFIAPDAKYLNEVHDRIDQLYGESYLKAKRPLTDKENKAILERLDNSYVVSQRNTPEVTKQLRAARDAKIQADVYDRWGDYDLENDRRYDAD